MGIESDKVVYEYLSRVGDVAQQRQLPSSTRMRLVSQLRDEIDRRRARAVVDSPAAVRRILDRLGSPDDVVTAAAGTTTAAPQPPAAAVPVQRDETKAREARDEQPEAREEGRASLLKRRRVPRPRPAEETAGTPTPDGPAPPHLASAQELGGSAVRPDWWGTPTGPLVDTGTDEAPGFVGGVEIPDLLKPPLPDEEPQDKPGKAEEGDPDRNPDPAEAAQPPTAPKPRLPRLPSLPRWSNPLLLLAAACLVAGAVVGNLLALAAGWLIAWASRRLTDTETKWAVVILPGLSLTAGVVWLWGRTEGRWGTPIAEGQMNAAIADTWPWVVRGAAVASALFLVWRSQRRR
ncbi:hypothetical protein [Streptomyces sp. NPDC057386]|uniref:hypothetical protein n=1 Tax=unclassified Streptomyces TaxID=2593676 RepID=UPI00363E8E11